MKKLFTLLACAAFISTQAQVLYTENFNGGSHTFTLNSSDMSSTAAGANHWVVNNNYTGGSYVPACVGFSTSIGSTANQPGGISGAPNSNYLHVNCVEAGSSGVLNANFLASDGGLLGCANDENYFAKMTTPISTTGLTNVNFSFWWLCAGSTATYGELYYSTNGGSTWLMHISNLRDQFTWTQYTYTNSVWDNQASLMFAFRFVNNFTFSASDPPMCVDDISIFVPASASITTGIINPTSLCAGASVNVPYTIAGTFTPGNIFSAQLSDASGSFASPITIGTLVSTSAGTISATIPGGTPPGTGYLIRVVSSTPTVIGSNSAALTISSGPTATAGNGGPFCTRDIIDLTSSGGVSYSWAGPNSFTSLSQNPVIPNALLIHAGTYTVTVTNAGGCTSTATTTVVVNSSPTAAAGNTGPYCVGDAAQLSASGGSGYDWSGPNAYTNLTQNPSILNVQLVNSGTYTVIVTSAQGCKDTAETFMLVQACGSGIEDENMNQVSIYPNPTTDVVTISINEQMINHTSIEVMNLVGSVVYNVLAIQPKTVISTESLGLRSGIYLIKINYENQHKVVRLIVR
jgi:hypothetical protein